jgi:hypothetical protein
LNKGKIVQHHLALVSWQFQPFVQTNLAYVLSNNPKNKSLFYSLTSFHSLSFKLRGDYTLTPKKRYNKDFVFDIQLR